MAATPDATPEFMSKDVLKPLLRLAKRRAVACAVCLTHDREAILFMHRRMKPRRAMEEVRHQGKALKLDLNIATIRFGRARVDLAYDSQTVLFTLNKPAADVMRRALLIHLRPVGFQHCEIGVDEALEDEEGGDFDEDTLDEEADEEKLRSARAAAGSLGPPPSMTAPSMTASAISAPPPPETTDTHDLAALHASLTHLVRELAATVVRAHGHENPLVELATQAQVCLKLGDGPGAASRIDRLRQGLVEAKP